jgi:RNA polymerase sigma-70 factor (ECF subfamily)
MDDRRSDEELVNAANAGESAAFDALYLRYREWVLRVALRFTQDRDDALDVLQETFLYLLRKFPLYPAIRNIALAQRRRRHGVPLRSPAAAADPPASTDDLTAVLAGLAEGQREVLLMRVVDDLSLAEIAAALEIPIGTVKSRLHGALERLRGDPRARRYFGQP